MGAVFFPPSSPVAISPHDLEEVSTDQVAVINSSITTTITTVDAVSLLQQLSLEEEESRDESIHESPTAPDHIYRSHVETPAIVHNNLAAFILENATGPKFANKIAIVDGATGTEYTYLQLYNMVKKLKAGLTSWGVKPKDVVLLLSPNCPEFPIVYLAVVLLGAVVAPSNPLNTHADIAKQLAQASVKFVVTVPDLLSKIEGCALPTMLIGTEAKCKDFLTSSIILLSDIIFKKDQTTESDQPTEHSQPGGENSTEVDIQPADASNEVDQLSEQFKSEIECHPEESDESVVTEEEQGEEEGVEQSSPAADEEFTSHPDDTCTLLFSSGTTGMSKAVELCHRNFMSAIAAYNALEPGASTSDMDVCLAIIPMYHVYGLGIVMLATLERGACVVTMERYSLPSMLQYVEKYKINVATLVPPILVQLVKNGDVVAKYDLSSLKIIATGAASLREDTMKSIAFMFPHAIMRQGYGMTEAPLISFSVVANERRQWGSVGPLVPGTEVRITHIESGKALPAMATGEVWVRGPQVMKGYLNNPETTAASLDSDAWLHTGDLGYVDTNGYLFIVDRLKEMIKFNAHQVAPGELEAVLLKHPRILDVAVVPFPDEQVGELPLAYVVKREHVDLTEAEVMSFVARIVAPHKKVRKVEFIEAIPKSSAGKILRKELIARHTQ